MRYRLIQLLLSLAVFSLPHRAFAFNQQVRSDLWTRAFSVPAADGSTLDRRDIVEDLSLSAWDLIPGSDDPSYRGPRLAISANLRIMGDLGVDSQERNSKDTDNYVPGLEPLNVEAMTAWFDATGFWNGALDIRLGRQIRMDTTGYFPFDGIDSTIHLPAGCNISLFVGTPVQAADPLGYAPPSLDGIDNGGRENLDPSQYPDRSDPPFSLAFGSELSIAPVRWFDAGVAVRLVGLGEDLRSNTVGARFDLGNRRVHVRGALLANPMMDRRDDAGAAIAEGTFFSSVEAAIGAAPFGETWLWLEYDLFRPIFEATSIFNVFDLLPRRDLQLRAERDINRRLRLSAWGFIRFEDQSSGLSGDQSDEPLSGAGGGSGASWMDTRREIDGRISLEQEWGETRMSVDAGGRRSFFGGRLWLGLRGAIRKIEDDFSESFSGTHAGGVITARFRIARMAHVIGEFENFYGGDERPRFSALVWLQLDFWR